MPWVQAMYMTLYIATMTTCRLFMLGIAMQWSHSCISSSCTERYRPYFIDGLELGHVLVGCVCCLCQMESVIQVYIYVDLVMM